MATEGRPGASPKWRGTLLRVLQFLVVITGFFLWWMAVFLLVSLFAVNVWSVTWTQIVLLSLGLTVPCAAVYLLVMIRRERKKQEDTK
ncbi:MAG: hypothetical protein IJK06_10635 [Clostridia bacterium]|nr:hypothetical protein [Clostridia bacterium]